MINIDDEKEGKQFAKDLEPLGQKKANAIVSALSELAEELSTTTFPPLAALAIMKVLAMSQFAFVSQTYKMISKPNLANDLTLDMLRVISAGNSDVTKEDSIAMATELIYLRARVGGL